MEINGEIISDAYLLRRTTLAVSGKHKVLKEAVREMRKIAGASGRPTLFADAKDNLLDTFQFEVPDAHKNEKPPTTTIDANLAGNQQYSGKRRRNDGGQQPFKRGRRNTFGTHPKGSCKNCPQSTTHTTETCYITTREKMGLSNG